MKITRATVEQYAKERGLEPVQIDGVPEGFSWKEPDITLANKTHRGKILKFKPLGEWGKDISYE